MIVVKLMGGLGNQMFQHAAGRSLAKKNDSKLFMDLSWFKMAANVDTPRTYELGCYQLPEKFIKPNKYTLIEKYEPSLKSRVYRLTKGLAQPYVMHYLEKGHQFNKDFFDQGSNTYLEGFWQSEKYFKDIRNELLEDFSYKKEPSEKNKQYISDINASNSIALHIRRGDYAANKSTKAFHGLVGLEYYNEAVSRLSKQIEDPTFFIFSDEPEWCQKNLKLNYPSVYVNHNKDGAEDMRLMRHCKNNIIANSSFSWWGAWLNNNPDKIVIAPKQWFADGSINTSDVIPREWIKL